LSREAAAWDVLLAAFGGGFTQPSFTLFRELTCAWVLCSGRRTVTRMIRLIHPEGRRAHDAYHRFLRIGAWNMAALWRELAVRLAVRFCPEGRVELDLDDTLFHKSGRKVEGAGIFRDAVRSLAHSVVYALGLNLVVLTLRVRPPWGGEPLGLPINMRLYRKGGPTHLDLAEEMIREVADWLPLRQFALACDGAYASLAGRPLPRTHVTSRMRRDAALYEAPPARRRKQRGRPRKKGRRLPTPEVMARHTRKGWRRAVVDERSKPVQRLLLCRPVLWYSVCPDRMVLLVIVRDPRGKQHDDFFFTTDLKTSGKTVASHYAGRWSIEDTFRNVKQALGGEDPQTWKGEGPQRVAGLSLWLYSAVWSWYITSWGTKPSWPSLPWYPAKQTPSFADALATLRRALWNQRIIHRCGRRPLPRKMARVLIEALSQAA
jgi:hypothetical protein